MFSEIHNYSVFVNQEIERDSCAEMKDRIESSFMLCLHALRRMPDINRYILIILFITYTVYSFFSASAGLVRMRRRVWRETDATVTTTTMAIAET